MSKSFLQSRNGFYSQLRAWVPESDAQAELAAPSAELRGANAGEASKLPFSWIMAQGGGSPAAVIAAPSALAIEQGPAPIAVSLTGSGVPYTQNFDSLLQVTGSTVPTDWTFSEAGANANATYSAGTGSTNGGDTWSYGVAGTNAVTDRAFGALASGNLQSTIGASFTNNTGATITSLLISYFGEQWRDGGAAAPNLQKLDFQYSLTATSLTTSTPGTWIDWNPLDFTGPTAINTTTGNALDGNASANRVSLSSTITSLAIANGATFWIGGSTSTIPATTMVSRSTISRSRRPPPPAIQARSPSPIPASPRAIRARPRSASPSAAPAAPQARSRRAGTSASAEISATPAPPIWTGHSRAPSASPMARRARRSSST